MPRIKIASEGICNFCGETFSKAAITRHIAACRAKRMPQKAAGKTQKTFWLLAEGREKPEYWLHFEISASTTLIMLDQFLRDVWLECCGHLSAFTIDKTRYELDTGGIDSMWGGFFGPATPSKSMKARLDKVLKPGMKFEHEYDFGSTTELTLKVIAEHEVPGQKKDLYIFSRNNPPNIPCAKCGKPAAQVCVECIYDGAQAWLCNAHTKNHKCGADMFLPVVNSPRVGTCGYTGDAELF